VKLNLPDTIYFLLRDIRHDWVRTLLTIFGMAMGIFSFFILSAFSQSLADYNQNVTLTRNLIVIQTDIIDPADAVLEESAIQAAESLPTEHVSRVSPVIFRHLRINDHMIQLRAARVEDWTSVFHMELLEGQWPKEFGEVAVGEGAAEAFGWKKGTQLTIYGSQFNVTAISRLPGSVFASVWMPLETADRLFGMKHMYQFMFVQAAPGADAEELRTQIQEDPRLAEKYSVFFEDSYSRKNNQILNDIRSLMIIGSNLALLAVTFGTYNSTSLSIIERSREIGILRAEGFSHKTLVNILGVRASLQSWIAFITGLVCAIVFIIYQRVYAQFFIFGFYISFKITWQIIIFGFLLTSILAIFGAWFSSLRLLNQDVNNLLRD
jgi:ABC-type antimicrobial peptide transport system permease subunit